ncbi:restriction endonuclease subunit S [Thiolapillus sp.]|uniref:restriction endonuclease subunit S n=6 Tax=Thiolapillus sp. TaxID=2017437 RepID=UPI003AF5431D
MDQFTYPKYDSYKDSGIEWVGLIPDSWDILPIRAIFHERKERNIGPKTDFILSVTKDRGVIPYDEKGNIGNKKSENIDNYKVVHPGDLVINKMNAIIGSLGLSAHYGALSQVYIVLYPRDISRNDYRYLGCLFKIKPFQTSLIKIGKGIMELRESIEFDEFKKLSLPLPALHEQRRIANFLDQKIAEIDEAIAKKQRLIELLKEQKAILINQAVTKGLNPDAPMRDSGVEWIGDIPSHWLIRKLKYFTEVQSGITLGKLYGGNNLSSYPYLRVANVQAGYFELAEIAELRLPRQIANQYLVRKGDILITEGGDIDKLGRGTVWKGEIGNCLHQNHIFAVRVNQRLVSEYFVSIALGADYGRRYFTHTANKTTNLASTNKAKLGNFPVAIPPINEQQKILEYCEVIDTEYDAVINTVLREVASLNEYKQVVVADAVTGKIKL